MERLPNYLCGKKVFLFSFFLVLFCFVSQATENKDELKEILLLTSTNPDSAIQLSENILLKPNILDSVKAKSNYCLGVAYYYKGSYRLSASYYEKALNSEFGHTNDDFRSACYNNLGVAYEVADNYEKALEYYLASLKIDEERDDLRGLNMVKINIGLLYYYLKQYDKSSQYSNEARTYFEEVNDHRNLALTLHNIAIVDQALGDYDEAYNKLKKVLTLYTKKEDPFEYSNVLNNLASLVFEKEDYKSAREYCDSSIQMAEENNFLYLLNRAKITKAKIFLGQGNIAKAEAMLALVDTSNFRTEEDRRLVKLQIAARKEHKDVFDQELADYVVLKDSVFSDKMVSVVNELEVKYKTEAKIHKIESQAQLLKTRKRNLVIAIIIIFILTGLLVLVAFYKTKLQRSYHILYLKDRQQKDNVLRMNNIRSVLKKEQPKEEQSTNSVYRELWERILIQMNEKEVYLNPAFTLQDLVKAVNSNNKYISETIKVYAKNNFNQFVNFYRVEKSKQLMNEFPLYSSQTIAEMSGFNSLSSFFRVFKEQTGLSPGRYREIGAD